MTPPPTFTLTNKLNKNKMTSHWGCVKVYLVHIFPHRFQYAWILLDILKSPVFKKNVSPTHSQFTT
jgi:hypothetical protein